MASNWEGKSKGTVSGYKIFVFIINKIGIRGAYFLLYFVTFYYCFFAGKSTKAIYNYFKKILHYSTLKSLISVYKSYLLFGKTLLDKTAITSGHKDKFIYNFDGSNNINELLAKKQGGILISAHVGNFELSRVFFEEKENHQLINLVIADGERQEIKEYLENVTKKPNLKYIVVRDDLNHIFEITSALNNGELVCFTGDRFNEDNKTVSASLMNANCRLPAGPFLLASRLKVPVIFVYVMKHNDKQYNLYARVADYKNRDVEGLVAEYTKSVEWMLQKYPLQWFNYYDFWDLIQTK